MIDDDNIVCKICNLPIFFNKLTKKWETETEWMAVCTPESGFREASVHQPFTLVNLT